ncbi:MAG: YMGG-like glycine zipper-containing protein [Alphaproteobacteria bacterium]
MQGFAARLGGLTALLSLASGAAGAMTPSVQVMPATNKPPEVFQQDQYVCMQYAEQQSGGTAAQNQAANQAVGSAIVGTILGAGLGAAFGGGRGAAIGAASGAFAGTTYGVANAQSAQWSIQQRYDVSYMQCMYAKGNQVPGFDPSNPQPPPPPDSSAPPPGYSQPPPPPSGSPPPPPPSQ